MSRPVIIRKGSESAVKALYDNSQNTITKIGTHYHFLNDVKDYVLYDWIRNTSPAYINTGVLCKKEYKYEFKVRYHDNSTLTQFYPSFGSITNNPRYGIWGLKRQDRSLESSFYYNGTMYGLPARTTLTQLNDIAIHTIDVYNYTVSIQLYRNGTLVD